MTLEEQFDSFVRWFGGEIIRDLLPRSGALPKNADYFFFDRTVVAELKCLEENYFGAQRVNEKLTKLAKTWVRDGILRPELIVKNRVSTDSLPERCALQVIDVFGKSLREAVTDANIQIKMTKDYFRVPEANGLLILANDGNLSLNPDLTMHILKQLFRNRFSAIESFIFCAPHLETFIPGIDKRVRIWVSGPTRDGDTGVSPELMNRIDAGWVEYEKRGSENQMEVIQVSDEDLLRRTQFLGRNAS